ncbi:hypothetical protein M8998_06320 [Sphingobacterium sp. lm-10]|uniref:hypothetical protein n=1 Tax=Sphingobacterium sp. lm-10 TaxID=2944904 RepID=UPI002021590F|nr:hypothetical protein [Sphingobacterium sp. lm-10]MCL7987548.1 hypothetical protein [Sphingobacterium sp. lm-10]
MTKKSMLSTGLALVCSILLISSCSKSDNGNTPTHNKSGYYAVHSFFQKEVDSLQQNNPTVRKTVGKGSEEETKTIHIKNWKAELGAFLSIDLSKPAYEGMYKVDSTAQKITYTALSEDVDVQSMSVSFDQLGQVESIVMVRNENNFLYQNKEQLSYLRGREYTMSKEQHILLLGTNRYHIVGSFIAK